MHYLAFKVKVPDADKLAFPTQYSDALRGHQASLHAQGLQDYRLFLDESTDELFCIMRVNRRIVFDEQLKAQLIQHWYELILQLSGAKEKHDIQWFPLKDVFHLNENVSKVF